LVLVLGYHGPAWAPSLTNVSANGASKIPSSNAGFRMSSGWVLIVVRQGGESGLWAAQETAAGATARAVTRDDEVASGTGSGGCGPRRTSGFTRDMAGATAAPGGA